MFSVLGRTCAGIWAPHSAKTIASLPEAEATVDTEIADLRDGKTNKIKVYPLPPISVPKIIFGAMNLFASA